MEFTPPKNLMSRLSRFYMMVNELANIRQKHYKIVQL